MSKENNIQSSEMIKLEEWIKENRNQTLTLSEYIEIFSKMTEEERNYIIMAWKMPQNEIESALKYYDGHNFPVLVDEISFINQLSKKYSVDKETIIIRIKQIRMINQAKKTTNKTKKRKK